MYQHVDKKGSNKEKSTLAGYVIILVINVTKNLYASSKSIMEDAINQRIYRNFDSDNLCKSNELFLIPLYGSKYLLAK